MFLVGSIGCGGKSPLPATEDVDVTRSAGPLCGAGDVGSTWPSDEPFVVVTKLGQLEGLNASTTRLLRCGGYVAGADCEVNFAIEPSDFGRETSRNVRPDPVGAAEALEARLRRRFVHEGFSEITTATLPNHRGRFTTYRRESRERHLGRYCIERAFCRVVVVDEWTTCNAPQGMERPSVAPTP